MTSTPPIVHPSQRGRLSLVDQLAEPAGDVPNAAAVRLCLTAAQARLLGGVLVHVADANVHDREAHTEILEQLDPVWLKLGLDLVIAAANTGIVTEHVDVPLVAPLRDMPDDIVAGWPL